jgi:hypothetical protein
MNFWFPLVENVEKQHPLIWRLVKPTWRSIHVSFESEPGKVYYDYLCIERAEYEIFRLQQQVQQKTQRQEPNYWLINDVYEEDEPSPGSERRIPPYVPSVRKLPIWWRIRRLVDAKYGKALFVDQRHQFLWQEQLAKEEEERLLAEQQRRHNAEREKKNAVMSERIELLKEAIRNRTPAYYLDN